MQLNELKAVLTRTHVVALLPGKDIQDKLPDWITSKARYSRDHCPIGLVRGEIVELKKPWYETRPISQCDLHDYQVLHKNGVLMRVRASDWIEDWNGDHTVEVRHGTFVPSDGDDQLLDVIVSHKSVWTSWSDYELKLAEMDKAREDADRKRDLIRDPQARIMGLTREELDRRNANDDGNYRRLRERRLDAEWRDVHDYDAVSRSHSWTAPKIGETGVIEITLDQAEKILGMLTKKQLDKLGV